MNYLELVNTAIFEAGVDLDDLTSANFDSPSQTKMYTRFKRWVQKAWDDIVIENPEWEFEKGTAVATIYPLLHVISGNRATAPAAGYTYESDSGNTSFTVLSSELLAGTWAGGDAEAFLAVEDITGSSNFILLEPYDELTPTPASGVFLLKYYGRYNPRTLVADLEEMNYETVSIQDPETGGVTQLGFVPWAKWKDYYETLDSTRGRPCYITETPEGYFDLWPRPDRPYTITFSYSKTVPSLEEYDDIPEVINEKYHEAIVWRAVMYYADYDQKGGLWAKAAKRHWFYMTQLDRDLGVKWTFGSSKFNE